MACEGNNLITKTCEYRGKSARFFSRFLIANRAALAKFNEGQLLGRENREWRGVVEHNLLAGVAADTIALLVGLPEVERQELVGVALIHDWDKRLDMKAAGEERESSVLNSESSKYNVEAIIKLEQSKQGLGRVTGSDWRDFSSWGVKEMILRYTDSSLIQTSDKRADFGDWRDRIEGLKKRHPEVNIKEGVMLYGIPLYDKLAEITELVEQNLYEQVVFYNPLLKPKYPKVSDLSILVRDRIIQRVLLKEEIL